MQFRQPRDSCSAVSRGLRLRSILVASTPPISFLPPPLSTLFASSDRAIAAPIRPAPQSIFVSRMSEPPFVPRERILKYQQYFQNLHKHTYLKGRYDMVTSVAIPLTLAASSLFFIGRGIYNMSHGIGKKA